MNFNHFSGNVRVVPLNALAFRADATIRAKPGTRNPETSELQP